VEDCQAFPLLLSLKRDGSNRAEDRSRVSKKMFYLAVWGEVKSTHWVIALSGPKNPI